MGKVTAILLAATVVATGTAVAAASDATYRGHGVSFRYPSSWHLARPSGLRAQTGTQLWSQWLSPTRARSVDLIMVVAYRSTIAVTPRTLERYRAAVAASIDQLTASAGGWVIAGPTITRMGGLPGYRFTTTATAVSGANVASTLVLVWKGHTEYFVNCQHATLGSRRGTVERACTQVLGSFRT